MRLDTFADDFQSKVETLKKSQANLDQLMLPFRSSNSFGMQKSEDLHSNESQKSPILQFHNPTTQLQAQTGKLLFGKLVNRLVVGGEKNPAIIEIKSGQGSFSGMRAIGSATQASTPGRLAIEIQKIV